MTTVRIDLDADLSSARRGRDFLRTEVAGQDVALTTDQLDVLELLASELVTNAVVHARSGLTLTLQLDRQGARVAVEDRDTRHPVVRRHDRTSLGGRGLALVDALSDAWGVDRLPDGKTVWFHLHLGVPPRSDRPDVPRTRLVQ